MAFADQTTGGRVVVATGPTVELTVKASSSVDVGDLLGYSSGWVRADSDAPIPAEYIALGKSDGGTVIRAAKSAIIDFGSGCTATAADKLYLSSTAGRYTATGPTVTGGQKVGEMVSAQVGNVSLPGSRLVSDTPSVGVGYAPGAGGAVTQLTNASTGVTLDTLAGQITTVALTTAAAAEENFTVTNSRVAATDVVVVATTYTGAGTPVVAVKGVAAGSFVVTITNLHAANALDAVLVINFAVIKGAAS